MSNLPAELSRRYALNEDADEIFFDVTVNRDAWVGVGVAAGTAGAMGGSDIVACVGDGIFRYPEMPANVEPSVDNRIAVAGGTCSFTRSVTRMTFSRPLSIAAGSLGVGIVRDEGMTLVWAFGDHGARSLASHGSNRGSATVQACEQYAAPSQPVLPMYA